MSRQRKSTHAPAQPVEAHAAYAALTARLTAFQTEISAQAKSRAAHEAPIATRAMAADLIAQMSRLMHRATEARGLPQLPTDRPVTLSELSIAFAQTHHAFDAFGKRMGYDQPVADAESERRTTELRNDLVRMMNVRIIMGIRTGYLVPSGNQYDDEKGELCQQFEAIVDRLELIVKEEALPDPNEKWF
ncbi:hypothetical protein NO932_13830 [Pelagibacterium sp. 26DY04]|uniref:hypothetical protein n=1 Tax=Pelagibacterium sp. 26DY04 TaxID=2967130 RepID=UPI0028163437|nr:hypothetical protein [Pelagibacterium sp. 26DY04]WMT85997.1 hypothetical protein NO932_13830 [Pelagibacterium sp. 26DY04]